MKIKFLILCLSCLFLFFLNINCSSSKSTTQAGATNTSASDDVDFNATSIVIKAPKMLISESAFAFPDVEEGTNVVHVWEIMNTGTDDLLINDVESSCGCTSAITDSKVIAPNSSTKLRTVFNTTGRLGMNTKFIIIHSNDPSTPARQLTLMGRVVAKDVSKN
jgi:hypothetical protein